MKKIYSEHPFSIINRLQEELEILRRTIEDMYEIKPVSFEKFIQDTESTLARYAFSFATVPFIKIKEPYDKFLEEIKPYFTNH